MPYRKKRVLCFAGSLSSPAARRAKDGKTIKVYHRLMSFIRRFAFYHKRIPLMRSLSPRSYPYYFGGASYYGAARTNIPNFC